MTHSPSHVRPGPVRAAARALTLALASATGAAADTAADGAALTIAPDAAPLTLVNVLAPDAADQDEVVRLLTTGIGEVIAGQPGFLGAAILRSVDSAHVLVHAQWSGPEALEAVGEAVAASGRTEMAEAFRLGRAEYHPFETVTVIRPGRHASETDPPGDADRSGVAGEVGRTADDDVVDTSESLAIAVRVRAQPGKRDELVTHLRAMFDEHAREDAFVFASVRKAADDPDGLFILEAWSESRAAFHRRLETHPAFTERGRRMAPLIAEREPMFLGARPVWARGRAIAAPTDR